MGWTPRNWKPIPGRGTRFFSSPKHPYKLWDPIYPPVQWVPTVPFPGGQNRPGHEAGQSINLLPWLRMCGFKPYWHAQNFSLTFYTCSAIILNDPKC
jgi:hypothetical protein